MKEKRRYLACVLHAVSGLFLAGITIAGAAQNGGMLTDRNIVDITVGSIQTAIILTEGGSKAFQNYINNAIKNADKYVAGHPTLPREYLDQIKNDVKSGNNKTVAKQF